MCGFFCARAGAKARTPDAACSTSALSICAFSCTARGENKRMQLHSTATSHLRTDITCEAEAAESLLVSAVRPSAFRMTSTARRWRVRRCAQNNFFVAQRWLLLRTQVSCRGGLGVYLHCADARTRGLHGAGVGEACARSRPSRVL